MPDYHPVRIAPVDGNGQLFEMTLTRKQMSTQQRAVGQGTQYSILVVEDDLALANLELEFLHAHGYSAVSAQSGELAIAMLSRFIPNLVVLDLELTSDISGWDVIQALRSLQAPSPIPVLITSSSATAVRKQIHSFGENQSTLDLLPKPYSLGHLLKRIQRMLLDAPK